LRGIDLAGRFDGGAGVAEHPRDADLVQPDPGGAESGEAMVSVSTEAAGCVGGLVDQGTSGVPVAVHGGGVGGGREERAEHGQVFWAPVEFGLQRGSGVDDQTMGGFCAAGAAEHDRPGS